MDRLSAFRDGFNNFYMKSFKNFVEKCKMCSVCPYNTIISTSELDF